MDPILLDLIARVVASYEAYVEAQRKLSVQREREAAAIAKYLAWREKAGL